MKIIFLENEVDTLVELAYLGNWIANATKLSDKRIKRFDALYNKILDQAGSEVPKEMNQEDLYDNVEEIIKEYETDILPSLFAKMFADFLYSSSCGVNKFAFIKNCVSHKVFRALCERELRTNGFKNVQILLPELEQEIAKGLMKEEER